jgi:hypothetical protein
VDPTRKSCQQGPPPPAVEPDCCLVKGLVFNVYTYLTKEECERQRSLAIQEKLKYEEEYLSFKMKQQTIRTINEKKAKEKADQVG